MNILCSKWNCKFRQENNSLQRLMTCRKETVTVGRTGHCKSFEKDPTAKCEHQGAFERKYKNGKMAKICVRCGTIVDTY